MYLMKLDVPRKKEVLRRYNCYRCDLSLSEPT